MQDDVYVGQDAIEFYEIMATHAAYVLVKYSRNPNVAQYAAQLYKLLIGDSPTKRDDMFAKIVSSNEVRAQIPKYDPITMKLLYELRNFALKLATSNTSLVAEPHKYNISWWGGGEIEETDENYDPGRVPRSQDNLIRNEMIRNVEEWGNIGYEKQYLLSYDEPLVIESETHTGKFRINQETLKIIRRYMKNVCPDIARSVVFKRSFEQLTRAVSGTISFDQVDYMTQPTVGSVFGRHFYAEYYTLILQNYVEGNEYPY